MSVTLLFTEVHGTQVASALSGLGPLRVQPLRLHQFLAISEEYELHALCPPELGRERSFRSDGYFRNFQTIQRNFEGENDWHEGISTIYSGGIGTPTALTAPGAICEL